MSETATHQRTVRSCPPRAWADIPRWATTAEVRLYLNEPLASLRVRILRGDFAHIKEAPGPTRQRTKRWVCRGCVDGEPQCQPV